MNPPRVVWTTAQPLSIAQGLRSDRDSEVISGANQPVSPGAANHAVAPHTLVQDVASYPVALLPFGQLFDPLNGAVETFARRTAAMVDIAEMGRLAAALRTQIKSSMVHETDPGLMTTYVSTVNDVLTRRVLDIACAEHGPAPAPWCWIAMGSEGRFEQTLSTDQDNGVIFRVDSPDDAQAVRPWFLALGQIVNRYLDICGIPHCPGNIMAGNPECCLSVDEWQTRFVDWIRTPDPQALLNASIFFDFRAIHGDGALAEALRATLLAYTRDNSAFLRMMALNALGVPVPIGAWHRFRTEGRGRQAYIDMKKSGVRLIVDVARILALASGSAHTRTLARLRDAGPPCGLHADDIDAAVQAFTQMQRMRLRQQQRALDGDAQHPNHLRPDSLNRLDQRILREALEQVRSLQVFLRTTYSL